MKVAGIILCGGQSRRMGQPKMTLRFGQEEMLARMVRLVSEVVGPIVVVSSAQQVLPALPFEVIHTMDQKAGRGPLEGIAAGLRAVRDQSDAAFVTGCDLPLIKPAFIQRMIELSEKCDIAIPYINGFFEPLLSVYHTSVLSEIELMLEANELGPLVLLDRVNTHRVRAAQLREVDPDLESLVNVNSPEDYHAALVKAGFRTG